MSILLPLLLFWAFRAREDNILTFLLVACLFGAASVINLGALGGAPITPAIFMLGVLLLRVLVWRGNILWHLPLRANDAAFWMVLLVVWGLVSAALLPRLFAGQTQVFAADRSNFALLGGGVQKLSLHTVSTNYTQSAYLLAALACFVAVRLLVYSPGGLERFRHGVLVLVVCNLVAVALNLGETYLHLPSVLDLVRNAGYVMMVGAEVGGLRRISGTFPEASAFAGFTMPLFAFVFALWRSGYRRRLTGGLAGVTLLTLLFSTSSTAYGSLAVYATLLALGGLWHLVASRQALRLGGVMWLAWAAAVFLCLLLLFDPAPLLRIWDFLQVTVFRKLESSSGVERSSWNTQAWVNFKDTWGVGIGLGSARASSFAMSLLSNLGVLGVALYAAFLLRTLFAAGVVDEQERAIRRAAAWATVAALVPAALAGGYFDLGVMFYAFAGAAAGPWPRTTVYTDRAPRQVLHA